MAPNAFVDWPSSALTLSSVGSTLYHQSVAHHYLQCLEPPSLDGYAFNCDGIVIGFYQNELYCQGASGGETFECGSFYHDGLELVGSTSVFEGNFRATNIDRQDDLLVSFEINDVTTCNVVSLDWHNYSLVDYFGLQCPVQNIVPDISFQSNHFAFGVSGDVALRSPLEIRKQAKIVRDSYGVYQWLDNGSVKLYFGPQQGRQATVLKGTLSKSELHVQGYEPSGPCTHDGTSTLTNANSLPRLPKRQGVAARALHKISRLLPLNAFGVEELWTEFKKFKSWVLMLRMGFGGTPTVPPTVPPLNMTLTAFLTQVVFKGEWPRIALHPSFVPLFLDKKNYDKKKEEIDSSSQ